MSYVIADIIDHGDVVKEFHIRREDGELLPKWLPGSHIAISFAASDGREFENHYSLIGAPRQSDTYRIAVQREPGGKGGSICLHDDLAIGRAVTISGPFNSFPLNATAVTSRVVLVAGGIGITPMMSMAHALSAQGIPFDLHYLARSRERLLLLDELRAVASASLIPHLSQESGRADLAALLGSYEAGRELYACGPVSLLHALAETSTQLGWPTGSQHFESFGARVQSDDKPLTVELSLSQMTVEVQPGISILDALIAADVFVSYDCKRGECGNCYAQVLEGTPVHRDICLTSDMRSQGMCTCVSWASQERLVLEL